VVLWAFIVVMSFVTYKFYNEEANIFAMVESAYKVTLAWALFPLIAGVIFKKTHSISWLLSIIFGIWVWLIMENISPEWFTPPQFWWFLASIVWFFVGQFLAKIYWFKDEK
jgi:Na+/proline symporter